MPKEEGLKETGPIVEVEAARRSGGPPAIDRLRVLVVSDSVQRVEDLQWAVDPHEVEITSVVFPEEWQYAVADQYDLALIDLDSELLESLLRSIRATHGQAEILVLVEMSRMAQAGNLAGLLPKYRAWPVGRDEMSRLARRRAVSGADRGQARGLF